MQSAGNVDAPVESRKYLILNADYEINHLHLHFSSINFLLDAQLCTLFLAQFIRKFHLSVVLYSPGNSNIFYLIILHKLIFIYVIVSLMQVVVEITVTCENNCGSGHGDYQI